jgi:hypothetical protein
MLCPYDSAWTTWVKILLALLPSNPIDLPEFKSMKTFVKEPLYFSFVEKLVNWR